MLDSLAVFNRAADRRGERGRDRVRQLRGGEEPGAGGPGECGGCLRGRASQVRENQTGTPVVPGTC